MPEPANEVGFGKALRRLLLSCLLLCGLAQLAPAQGAELRIRVLPTWGADSLRLGQALPLPSGDSIVLERLRFYISGLQCLDSGGAPVSEEHAPRLLDLASPAHMSLALPVHAPCAQLALTLGIDSLTNVSGALGGDLDPTTGMYWAWQSGYINLKLEGTARHCPARNHRFQFHLGGYLPPHASAQRLSLPVPRAARAVTLAIDLAAFFAATDLATTYEVMRPCAAGTELSRRFASLIRVLP